MSKEGPLIAAVDVGGSKAACVIAALAPMPDGEFEPDILGVGQHGGLAVDRANGGAADPEHSIRAAIDAAEHMAGETITSAHFAVGGRVVAAHRIGVDLPLASRVVTDDDLTDCRTSGVDAARKFGRLLLTEETRLLVDGEPAVGHATGLIGVKLSIEMLSLNARTSAAANAEALIGRCGLKSDGLVAAPFAAAEAVLIDDEKELGVISIDMGARATEYAVYDRGVLVGCGGVNVGGDHVTRDIAQIFGADLVTAERIKTLYGTALVGTGDEHRLIDFPQLGDPGEVARHPRAELANVIASRLEETLELVFAAATTAAPATAGVRRLVLTGGGALLLGAVETAERVIGAKARLGRPLDLVGAPEMATAPQFAVALGVVRYAAKQASRRGLHGGLRGGLHRRRSNSMDAWLAARRHDSGAGGRLIGGVGAWLKANF